VGEQCCVALDAGFDIGGERRLERSSSGLVTWRQVDGQEGVGESRAAWQGSTAAHPAGIPGDDVEPSVDLVVEDPVVAEELDARSAGSARIGDQRADPGVGVRCRQAGQRQADGGAGGVGGVDGHDEESALPTVTAGLPAKGCQCLGDRRGGQELLDLRDDDIGLVELDVVAGVVDRDELGGRRERHPVLLTLVPHVVESRCLDRVETREGVFGGGDDAEGQGTEAVDGRDVRERCRLVELLGVGGRVGRVGAPLDEPCRRVGPVGGHGAAGGGPRRGRGVDQDERVDLVGIRGGEGHGLGAAVGVAHDHERRGFADPVQEGAQVAGGGGEGLGCGRRIAGSGTEPGVGADASAP
jgi:hypothetical protein